jgi:phosphoglycerol transferase MdoB-like AlkP superfamily enzyme
LISAKSTTQRYSTVAPRSTLDARGRNGHNITSFPEVIMLAYIFVLVAVAVRFLPHPLAFTPVGASLLFFGARGSRRWIWAPLALLAASDVVLTTLVYRYPFSWDHFVTWAWYVGMLMLGTTLKQNGGALRILGAALAGSVSFFVLSNFAVWAAWEMYPRTFAGLMACYDAGLPFFRRALAGDVLFTCVMFATPVLLNVLAQRRQRSGNHIAPA